MCGGSEPSRLKKKNRYPLILKTVGTTQLYQEKPEGKHPIRNGQANENAAVQSIITVARSLFVFRATPALWAGEKAFLAREHYWQLL